MASRLAAQERADDLGRRGLRRMGINREDDTVNAMTRIPEDEDLLTMKDLVARTKLHRATIYRMIGKGTFPAGRPTGDNSRRWTRREIREWIGGSVSLPART